MPRFNNLLLTFLLTFSLSLSAGEFKVNGEVIGDSSVIEYITANYEARVIKIVTNGSAHFSRIDDTVDEPGGTQQQLVVDDVVIGSSDLITWFLINPNNDNVRLKTSRLVRRLCLAPAVRLLLGCRHCYPDHRDRSGPHSKIVPESPRLP